MKRLALIAALVAGMTSTALASTRSLSGKVAWFAVAEDGANSQYTGQVLQLAGARTDILCKSDPSGSPQTFIRLPDTARGDQMRATIMSALLAGKTLTIGIDDTRKDTMGVCYARSVWVAP